MTFSLVNMVLLPLGALVAAPILIHLFARAKPPEYMFSSVQFLRRVVRTTIRLKRPRDLLLLAVRTLLVAAVVALFLRPILFADGRLAGGVGQRSVVVVIDASASMAYMDAAQTRFAQACAQASERLSALRPGDTANIVWMRSRAEPVFPEVGPNVAMLQEALRRARVTTEPADVDGALRLAANLLKTAPGRREICLFSDFQKTSWGDRTVAAPAGVAMVAVRIGTADGINRAMVRMDVTPSVALAGETVTIGCEVGNFGPVARRASVYLAAGESRQKQEILMPAWGRATAAFPVRFAAPGVQVVHAQVEEDSFPADDQRWLAVNVQDRLKVGVLAGTDGTAARWVDALEALGWAQVSTLRAEDLDQPLDVDAALLEGWDGSGGAGIVRLLDRGGAVLWMPARGTPVARLGAAGLRADKPLEGGERVTWEQGGVERVLRLVKPDDSLFHIFASGEHGDPAKGRFRARLAMPRSLPQGDTVLMAYDDGVPALARIGGSDLWLWNLPLSRDLSDWALQPEFVALMGEMLVGGRTGPRGGTEQAMAPGDRLTLAAGRELVRPGVSLEDEAGGRVATSVRGGQDGSVLVSEPVPAPGLYTWRNRSERLGVSVVNFPVAESDLRACQPNAIERMGFAVAEGGGSVRNLHEGVPLWPTLLAVASLLLLIEAGLVLWAGKTP